MPVHPRLAVECHPLMPERWPDLERLFGPRGACGGCWCMWWRLPRAEFLAGKGEENRQVFRHLVDSGETVGLLAYVDGIPAGWCAVASRAAYPALARSRILKPVDETPVWSVTCFFVAHPPVRAAGAEAGDVLQRHRRGRGHGRPRG